ncbi:MAG: hypothetical protein NWE89_01350 [Candidatus Bathyarchaeota archaeon]|nr:hypothetical protein [Candidatus Bathyarchaeota archaeon]
MVDFVSIGIGAFLVIFAYEYRRWRENEGGKRRILEDIRLLREKMDDFYGPLFGNLTIFHVGDRERTKREFIDPFLSEHFIRDKYHTMASDKLRELLDRYFDMGERDIRMEHGKPDDKWKALLDEIRETIQIDFEKLKNEYNELAGS